MRLYLVRHAAVTVRPALPSSQWHLSPEGRAAAEALAENEEWSSIAVVYSSPEPKAIATAQRIASRHGLRLQIERDLREIERPWAGEGYQEQVKRYLGNEVIESWEPYGAALARVRSCVDAIASNGEDAAIVSHGLALTLYVADLLGLEGGSAFELWSKLSFPDVAVVEAEARRMVRGFG